ncbi:hypothetical protein H0H93_013775 [Arthromyces matolae]|nr:hypothetical protein H0H93_013775 [Arthromyces matolae]
MMNLLSGDLKDEFDGLPEEIQNETNLIYDYLQLDSNSDVTTSAQTVASNILQSLQARNAPMSFKDSTQYDIYYILDGAFITVAQFFPNTHDPLVALLGALKEHPRTNDLGPPFIFAVDEIRLRYCDPPSDQYQPEMRDAWTNLNHFLALIHKANVLDLSYFAECTISESFRRGKWAVSPARWYPELAAEGHVPAAAQWIMICGEKLYRERSTAKDKWVEWESNLEWLVEQDHRKDSETNVPKPNEKRPGLRSGFREFVLDPNYMLKITSTEAPVISQADCSAKKETKTNVEPLPKPNEIPSLREMGFRSFGLDSDRKDPKTQAATNTQALVDASDALQDWETLTSDNDNDDDDEDEDDSEDERQDLASETIELMAEVITEMVDEIKESKEEIKVLKEEMKEMKEGMEGGGGATRMPAIAKELEEREDRDVAIRAMLVTLRAEREAEFAKLREEREAEIATLRAEREAEFAMSRAEREVEFATLRAEREASFAKLRAEQEAVFAKLSSKRM